MPSQCFVEISDLKNFARYVCATREYPLKVYSHDLNGQRVVSSGFVLTNTLLSFYTPLAKSGRYLSYKLRGGKEYCEVVNSTKALVHYAPIVHLESLASPLKTNTKKIEDEIKPLKVEDLGSLARIVYDPDEPETPDLNLFLFAYKKNWVIGNISSIDLDDAIYCFNYVRLDNEPTKPFLRYSSQDGKEPRFTEKLEHGYSYLSVIKLKECHTIFGLN